jgi:hypothetical protein
MPNAKWDKRGFIQALRDITAHNDFSVKTTATREERQAEWDKFAELMENAAPAGIVFTDEKGSKALAIRVGAINRQIDKIDSTKCFKAPARPKKQQQPAETVADILQDMGIV